jgi:hypothetical protein
MTFPPLASQFDFSEVRKRIDHLRRIEPQGAASLNEWNATQIYPLIERAFRNADAPRKLVDVDQCLFTQ